MKVLDHYRGTDPRIKITSLKRNAGISAATNRAVEISTGEFIALRDNDDEITPDALYEIAKAVNADPGIDFLYTDEDRSRRTAGTRIIN